MAKLKRNWKKKAIAKYRLEAKGVNLKDHFHQLLLPNNMSANYLVENLAKKERVTMSPCMCTWLQTQMNNLKLEKQWSKLFCNKQKKHANTPSLRTISLQQNAFGVKIVASKDISSFNAQKKLSETNQTLYVSTVSLQTTYL